MNPMQKQVIICWRQEQYLIWTGDCTMDTLLNNENVKRALLHDFFGKIVSIELVKEFDLYDISAKLLVSKETFIKLLYHKLCHKIMKIIEPNDGFDWMKKQLIHTSVLLECEKVIFPYGEESMWEMHQKFLDCGYASQRRFGGDYKYLKRVTPDHPFYNTQMKNFELPNDSLYNKSDMVNETLLKNVDLQKMKLYRYLTGNPYFYYMEAL